MDWREVAMLCFVAAGVAVHECHSCGRCHTGACRGGLLPENMALNMALHIHLQHVAEHALFKRPSV